MLSLKSTNSQVHFSVVQKLKVQVSTICCYVSLISRRFPCNFFARQKAKPSCELTECRQEISNKTLHTTTVIVSQ